MKEIEIERLYSFDENESKKLKNEIIKNIDLMEEKLGIINGPIISNDILYKVIYNFTIKGVIELNSGLNHVFYYKIKNVSKEIKEYFISYLENKHYTYKFDENGYYEFFLKEYMPEKYKIKYIVNPKDKGRIKWLSEKEEKEQIDSIYNFFFGILKYDLGLISSYNLYEHLIKFNEGNKIYNINLKTILNEDNIRLVCDNNEEELILIKKLLNSYYNDSKKEIIFENHELCYAKIEKYIYLFNKKEKEKYSKVTLKSLKTRFDNLDNYENDLLKLLNKQELIKEYEEIKKWIDQ